MNTIKLKQTRALKRQKGVTMIEYAMIAALIAIAALVAIQMVGNGVNTTFNKVKTAVNGS